MNKLAKRRSIFIMLIMCLCVVIGCLTWIFNGLPISVSADIGTGDYENLIFTLNKSGTAYGVKARNKTVTEVEIPDTYNDLPVTEILDCGFMGCKELKKITVPDTVLVVNEDAFSGCNNLESFYGMINVESIFDYAFSGCVKLKSLILPSTIQELGDCIIEDVKATVYVRDTEESFAQKGSNWADGSEAEIKYGNDIDCEAIFENDQKIGYRIRQGQGIHCPDEDFILRCGVVEEDGSHKPILEIAKQAFKENSFKTFTLLKDYDVQEPYKVKIESRAFYKATVSQINIEVEVEWAENCTKPFLDCMSTEAIYLPDSVESIPAYAFTDCESLKTIRFGNSPINTLSSKIKSIGEYAFSGCKSIENFYIYDSVNNVEQCAFEKWGDSPVAQNINVEHSEEKVKELWDKNWRGDNGLNFSIEYDWNKIIIYLDKQGGSGGTSVVKVKVGEKMPEAIAPEMEGFTFKGYYTEKNGKGDQIYDEYMLSDVDWKNNQENNFTLYADWEGKPYRVYLSGHGITVQVQYGQLMREDLSPLEKEGYTFKGYYWSETGTYYYDGNMNSIREWDIPNNVTLDYDWVANKYDVALGGTNIIVEAQYDADMPSVDKNGMTLVVPTKSSLIFKGYFEQENGNGTQYYDANMKSVNPWNIPQNTTLYPKWEQKYFTVTFENKSGFGAQVKAITVCNGDVLPYNIPIPTTTGYKTSGFYYAYKIANRMVYNSDGTFNSNNVVTTRYINQDLTLFYYWEANHYYFHIDKIHARADHAESLANCDLAYNDHYEYASAPETMTYYEYAISGDISSIDERGFSVWRLRLNGSNGGDLDLNPWIDFSTDLVLNFDVKTIIDQYYPNYSVSDDTIYFRAVYRESTGGCVSDGTLITLADGRQVPVESLTGNEQLLVWNLHTGTFDVAPILFIDCDPAREYRVVNLYFSDGTSVKVITEHGFWDATLNQYVYLDENAEQYIGHWFNKQTTNQDGWMVWTNVQLVNVVIQNEYTSAWSPVTYGYLCYYVNGMLSMPGGISGLFNIFEVDAEAMKYDEVAMEQDIAQYGLFTYEEFTQMLPVPQDIFDAFNAQYFKVAIGKGLVTEERLAQLVERYAEQLGIN